MNESLKKELTKKLMRTHLVQLLVIDSYYIATEHENQKGLKINLEGK